MPIWEKFIFLVSLAGFTGASRLPIGPIWADPVIRERFLEGCREIERLARAEGVPVAADVVERISSYVAGIPASMRSSLLIDLSQGKRIEVEQLQGSVVRRAAARRRARADYVDAVCGAEAVGGRGTPIRVSSASKSGLSRRDASEGSTAKKITLPCCSSASVVRCAMASSVRPRRVSTHA